MNVEWWGMTNKTAWMDLNQGHSASNQNTCSHSIFILIFINLHWINLQKHFDASWPLSNTLIFRMLRNICQLQSSDRQPTSVFSLDGVCVIMSKIRPNNCDEQMVGSFSRETVSCFVEEKLSSSSSSLPFSNNFNVLLVSLSLWRWLTAFLKILMQFRPLFCFWYN